MTEWLGRIWPKLFKIYFALCLLGFTLAVLLMNLPRVLASENAPKDPLKVVTTTKTSPKAETLEIPEKFYQWSFTEAGLPDSPHGYMQFEGNKMLLKVRF